MQIPLRSMMEGVVCTSAILALGFLPLGCAGTPPTTTLEQAPTPSSIEVPRPEEFPAADKILQGFDPRTKAAPWRQGDQILYGLSLRNGDTAERWLMLLTVQSDHSLRRVLYAASSKDPKTGKKSTTGIFSNSMSVEVRVFSGDTGMELGSSDVQVPGTILGRGILDPVEALLANKKRIEQDGQVETAAPASGTKMMGAAVVMSTILRVVKDDPVLANYLWQVVEKPGILSVLTGFGIDVSIHTWFSRSIPASQIPSNLSSERQGAIVPMVISVNGSAALLLEFLALDSQRPYALCGGLVALQARHPTRTDLHLGAVLLAARLAPQRPSKTKRE